MRILDASRRWFAQCVAPRLEAEFGPRAARIAVGRAGRGSECFGYDDELSRDHDCEVGVCLWLTAPDEREFGFALERFYSRVRREFPPDAAPVPDSRLGAAEHGVMTIGEFYRRHLGFPGVPTDWRQWLHTPEHAFAEAVNGEVFRDDLGEFTAIRREIASGMPEDVRRKKLAARAIFMAQSGQYNFPRCLRRGETGAAALALAEFVRNAVSMIFLLNRRFAPYYKWQFRALRELPELADLAPELEDLLVRELPDKPDRVDRVCARLGAALRAQGLSDCDDVYLEPHAFAITAGIRSRALRDLHVMEG